jgi:hypothetical protein
LDGKKWRDILSEEILQPLNLLAFFLKFWRMMQQCKPLEDFIMIKVGGGAGIRTLGGVTPTTIFETVPFDRSGTPPHFGHAIKA